MGEASVGSVSMKITASGKSAANNINTLANAMQRLSDVSSGMNYAGLASLSDSMATLGANSGGVKTAASALTGISAAVERLRSLDLGTLPQSFSNLSQSVSGFSSFTGMLEQVKEFSRSITSLRSAFKRINEMDVSTLAPKLEQIVTALKPLTDEMLRGGAGVANYGTQVKDLSIGLKQLSQSANAVGKSSSGLTTFQKAMNFASMTAKVLSTYYVLRRVVSLLQGMFTNISSYIENMNLFSIAMGESAKAGQDLAQKMQDVLGVDSGEAMRYMGVFNNLLTSFGNTSEAAETMSTNLTQLGYDFASFFNIATSDSFEKIQSGLSGQTKPLRQLGIDISEARLQQELYALGLNVTYSSLTQADKAQLRYIAILKQGTNALGDMSRTLTSPMNQMRVLQAQMTILGRSIGSIFIPALVQIIPVVTAVVEILAQGASAMASFFGFDITDFVNASTTQKITTGYSDISDSLDDVGTSAASTSKEMANLIGGFDELNVMQDKAASSGSKGATGNLLSGIALPSYDMFQSATANKVNKIVEDIKKRLKGLYDVVKLLTPLLAGLLAAFVAFKTVSKINDIWVKVVSNMQKGIPLAGSLALKIGSVVGAFVSFYEIAKMVTSGQISLAAAIGLGTVAFAGFATAATIAFGSAGIGIAVTAVAALTGVIIGNQKAMEAQNMAMLDSVLYNNGGAPIEEISAAFTDFTTVLNQSAQAISGVTDEYENNNALIDTSAAKLVGYQATLDELGSNVSENFVPNVKSAFDDMYSSIASNMELTRTALIGALVTAPAYIKDQLNIDIPEVTSLILDATGKIDEKSKALQKQFEDIYAQWQDNRGSTALIQQMLDISSQMYGLSDSGGQAIDDFNAKVAGIGKVDFQSESDATKALQDIQDAAQETKDSIDTSRQTMSNMIDDLVSKGGLSQSQGASMKGLYDQLFTLEKKDVVEKQQQAIDIISQAYDDMVRGSMEKAKPGIGDYMNAFTSWIFYDSSKSIQETAQYSAGQQLLTKALNSSVGKSITDAKASLAKEMEAFGSDTVSGYVSGVEAGAGDVADAMSDLGSLADSSFHDSDMEFGSPSKKMISYGKDTTQGYAGGVLNSIDVAVSAIRTLGSRINAASAELFSVNNSRQYGQSFGTGLAAGVTSTAGQVINAGQTIVSDLKNIISNGLSYSVMQSYGYSAGIGLSNGIYSRSNDVRSAMNSVMSQVSDAVRNAIRDLQNYANANPITVTIQTRSTGSTYGRTYTPQLAGGGVAYSRTDATIAEYQGATSNPEIVAPQSIIAETVQSANAPMASAIVRGLMQVVDAINNKDTTVVVGDDAVGSAAARYASKAKNRTGVNPLTT